MTFALALVVISVVGAVVYARLLRRLEHTEEVLRQALARVYDLEEWAREESRRGHALEVSVSATADAVPRGETRVDATSAPPPFEAAPAFAAAPTAPRDWEAIIGGNLLNKIGALVLVVGVGLFLAYSLTHLGPAGKVGIGYAAGLSMLVAGILLERQPGYSVFARGFIGGGWAATYFTTYALYALPAARLIDDPVSATLLLLAVSVLMVIHSLAYRTEPVTVLAYFISFATLNITPLTGFTVVASLFLAVSLMAAAYRFTWSRLAVAGVLFAYGTFAITYQPAVYGRAGILNGQSILWIYWVVFEAYDLIELRRRRERKGIEGTLFLLNAVGFVGASVLHEWSMRTSDWALFLTIAAAAYVASAFLRSRIVLRDVEAGLHERLTAGGYEPAAGAAALLAAAAIVERFTGIQVALGLFLEAELIVLAGLALRDRFPVALGSALMVLPAVRLVIDGVNGDRWAPLAAAMGATFYVNRYFIGSGWIYPAAGSLLLVAASAKELPDQWIPPVWGAALVFLAWVSRQKNRFDLRLQAYAFAMLVAARTIDVHWRLPDVPTRVLSCGAGTASLFAAHRLLSEAPWLVPLATAVATTLIAREVRGGMITVAWGCLASVLVLAGFSLRDRALRLSGLGVLLLSVGKLFVYDLRHLETMARILSFVVLGLILLGASWVYTRFRDQIRRLL